MSQWCDVCGVHEYNFMNCDNCFCPLLHVRLAIELGKGMTVDDPGGPLDGAVITSVTGPNDVFEISGDGSEHQDQDDPAQ
jgi:hypothetical protein